MLLLRISAAPDTVQEYTGDTPVKVMAAVEMAAEWENEIIAIGVRHVTVLESYEKALREYLPDRPLFVVTGANTSFVNFIQIHVLTLHKQVQLLLCQYHLHQVGLNASGIGKEIDVFVFR